MQRIQSWKQLSKYTFLCFFSEDSRNMGDGLKWGAKLSTPSPIFCQIQHLVSALKALCRQRGWGGTLVVTIYICWVIHSGGVEKSGLIRCLASAEREVVSSPSHVPPVPPSPGGTLEILKSLPMFWFLVPVLEILISVIAKYSPIN